MRNDIASAQKWADEAAALSADDKMVQSGLHMLHGDVLARLGRAPEAEKELLEEIRLYPGPPRRPRFALGALRVRGPPRGEAPLPARSTILKRRGLFVPAHFFGGNVPVTTNVPEPSAVFFDTASVTTTRISYSPGLRR